MCNQIRGVIQNFIWGGKAIRYRAKVKWDSFILPSSSRGLGIINPKAQLEALLTKLLVKGLSLGCELWKMILRHHANQVQFLIHGKGIRNKNIN
jgi:hypothetical protein